MQKTTLIAFLIVISLYSGLAWSCPGSLSPANILHVLASFYAPSDPNQNDRYMTFGREHVTTEPRPVVPQQTYLK